MPAPEFLVVGMLVGPHGLAGEVKLRPLTEFPERLPRLKRLTLRFPDGALAKAEVLGRRWHQGMLLVRLEGYPDRTAADALRGVEVLVPAAEAPTLPEGRFYEHEILGLRVLTPTGEELGVVSRIIPGPNDVYVAGPYLIPATRDAVIRLDPPAGVLVVRSKEYLLGEDVPEE
jgi:16S rRNA processing protein RimM